MTPPGIPPDPDVEPGALRVWWIPQVPGRPFLVAVPTLEEGVRLMNILARYDQFQLDEHVKPDYSNAGGLERYEDDNPDGVDSSWGWFEVDLEEYLGEYAGEQL